MENATNFDLNSLIQKIGELVTTYGIKFLMAVVVLIIGLMVIKALTKSISKGMARANISDSLVPFLRSLISTSLKILLVISVMSMVGIQMVSFVAVMGAAGLAVGMALQGTLQNFAGGVIILINKPYKVGDVIETQGYLGSVKEIQIFNTILVTGDNKTVIVPNSPIATGSLINFSAQDKRRVDFTFGIGYSDDIDKAREIIRNILLADDRVHKDPEPFIKISELADSSVNFATRVWVNTDDYWNVFFETNEKVKKAFDSEGVSIPFPQTDVHVYNH